MLFADSMTGLLPLRGALAPYIAKRSRADRERMLDMTLRPGIDIRPNLPLRHAFDSAMPAQPLDAQIRRAIFVALFDLEDWQPWHEDAFGLLDHAEQKRVTSRRSAVHQQALAMSYALHRLLLAKALVCDALSVPISRDEAGCPRITGCTLSTSLSHAEHLAVAIAVSATGSVGVDMEATSRASAMPELAEWVCHPSEWPGHHAGRAGLASEALLGLWVRKEAFLKAAGVGLGWEMRSFAAPDGGVLPVPGGGCTQLAMLEAGADWTAAIAGTPGVPVTCAWLRPFSRDV